MVSSFINKERRLLSNQQNMNTHAKELRVTQDEKRRARNRVSACLSVCVRVCVSLCIIVIACKCVT